MGKVFKIALMGVAVAFFAWGCSKEKPQTDPEPKADPVEAPADTTLNLDALVADTLSADSLARLEAERLEAERARLEEMINRIMLEDVYFDYDRSDLTENAKRLLAQVAEILVNENRFIVTVEGHTDARGTEDYNISLGARRSTVVREFLIAYGVDANRLLSVSYGKERPKVQGSDETAYSKNRRAHFRVSIDQ
jgi:peptidoglycan-associated lipoprotein